MSTDRTASTAVVSAATISTGFAGYLQSFIDVSHEVVVTVLLLVVGAVAAKGMNGSAWFMALTTLVGIGALLLLLVTAFYLLTIAAALGVLAADDLAASKAPLVAVVRAQGCVMAVVLLLALLVPLKTLASITSLLILLVFASVHTSFIVLKRREQPVDVPRAPAWVPYAGACLCLLAVAGQGVRMLGAL